MQQKKNLGLIELVAIAIGGMVGGGIFTILGISTSIIGNLTPIAIGVGGLVAFLAAYSYVKLGVYYKDEGATYSFVKRTYPNSNLSASIIGWLVIFGYISTLALYAYTFSSYALSGTSFADNVLVRKITAIAMIGFFTLVNVWSVKGMGKIEDLMVYTKLIVLIFISFFFIKEGAPNLDNFIGDLNFDFERTSFFSVLIVSSLTFVAYEGFQLVINAVDEVEDPEKNIKRGIYLAVIITTLLYVIISLGALLSIPQEELIQNKEYALAAGAEKVLGGLGANLVIFGALLATSSAVSGTIFGSSRQVAVIARDGYFPSWLSIRKDNIPRYAIITMAAFAGLMILVGGLELILEFGSITFLLVSFLIAVTNHRIRKKTNSSVFLTLTSIIGLFVGGGLILYYEFVNKIEQVLFILALYIILSIGAWLYSLKSRKKIS